MMRKVRLMFVAVCTVVATALALASPANAMALADGSHVGGVTNSPAGAAGPGAAAVSAVTQTGIAWTSCQGMSKRFQCAKVSVPLNWQRPDGPQIKLAVIRYLASDQKHLIGSMFVDPGGPGSSGVGIVQELGPMFDAWGGGRFNVVGWDPRGTNDSDPVSCFTSQAAEARFWQGVQIPVTAAASAAYARKAAELARRCGQVSGQLLDNISTEDTARDLNYLRQLVGDRQLTYVGLSYGSLIGQIYANMFPGQVRAMLLDGIVDAAEQTSSAEARLADQVGSVDEVFFQQFVAQCQRAGPSRCALAGHSETVAQRVARLFATARRAPIPAPHANPPGVLDYSDLLLSTFNPIRGVADWPQFAKDLNAAASGDASALEDAARGLRSPAGFSGATVSAAISCLDGPASEPVSAWPSVIGNLTQQSTLWGSVLGWWLWAPCAANWPGHATERYTGPWNAKTKTPILLLSNRFDPATSYHDAQVAEQRLGNAVLLTENGYGHLTLTDPSSCVEKWRIRYLVNLVTPPRGTVCAADQAPFS
jgi:pimeloyl-ACP methyl ester carboxylesterase